MFNPKIKCDVQKKRLIPGTEYKIYHTKITLNPFDGYPKLPYLCL